MKICLKERSSGLWLKPSGKWESSREGALAFTCGEDAIKRAESERPLDVQVCFEAHDPNLSFELGRKRGDFLPEDYIEGFEPKSDEELKKLRADLNVPSVNPDSSSVPP